MAESGSEKVISSEKKGIYASIFENLFEEGSSKQSWYNSKSDLESSDLPGTLGLEGRA